MFMLLLSFLCNQEPRFNVFFLFIYSFYCWQSIGFNQTTHYIEYAGKPTTTYHINNSKTIYNTRGTNRKKHKQAQLWGSKLVRLASFEVIAGFVKSVGLRFYLINIINLNYSWVILVMGDYVCYCNHKCIAWQWYWNRWLNKRKLIFFSVPNSKILIRSFIYPGTTIHQTWKERTFVN